MQFYRDSWLKADFLDSRELSEVYITEPTLCIFYGLNKHVTTFRGADGTIPSTFRQRLIAVSSQYAKLS